MIDKKMATKEEVLEFWKELMASIQISNEFILG
jgi:hypothetical protein